MFDIKKYNTPCIICSLCICLTQRTNRYFATRGFARERRKSARTNQLAAIDPDRDVDCLEIPARQISGMATHEKAKASIPRNVDTRLRALDVRRATGRI